MLFHNWSQPIVVQASLASTHHQNETSMKLFRQENGEEEEGQKAEKKELLNELSSTAKTKELMPS